MKIRIPILISILAACFAIIFTGCDKVQSILHSDLELKMMVQDARGLHENTPIYMVQPQAEACVGRITKVKSTETGNSILYLSIKYDYRALIHEGSLFMVNRPLLSMAPSSILIDTLPKDKATPRLESGSIVHETSYAQYNLMMASIAMKDVFDSFMQQSKAFINELEDYINSNEFDQFMSQLNQLSKDIATFTKEQKERFENEILPQLEKKMDEAMKNFTKNDQDYKKKEQLQKKMNQIKDQLQV
jgi:hypothetical protein